MSDKKPDTLSLSNTEDLDTPAAPSSGMPAEVPEILDKLYFKNGEAFGLTCVQAHVLRFWEFEFSRVKPHRIDAGQRLYPRSNAERILGSKHLLL